MIALQPGAQLPSTGTSSWPHLDVNVVIQRVDELVRRPNLLDQAGLGLCGEAAFYRHILQHKPTVFSSMANSLLRKGIGFIGDLKIRPDWIFPDLRNADYPALVKKYGKDIPKQADWMVLSALR